MPRLVLLMFVSDAFGRLKQSIKHYPQIVLLIMLGTGIQLYGRYKRLTWRLTPQFSPFGISHGVFLVPVCTAFQRIRDGKLYCHKSGTAARADNKSSVEIGINQKQ